MTEKTHQRQQRVRWLHEVIFSLNLGFAIGLDALLSLLGRPIGFVHGKPEVRDTFLDTLSRINNFFHLHPLDGFGIDVLLIVFTLAFFLPVFILVRVNTSVGVIDTVLNWVAPIVALAAVPIVWASRHSIGAPSIINAGTGPLVVLEFAMVAGGLFLTRKHPIPAWYFVLTSHYGVWLLLLFQEPWSRIITYPSLVPLASELPILLSIVSPCAGLAWALFWVQTRRNAGQVL